MKFQFKKLNKLSVFERFGGLNIDTLSRFLDSVKEGKEMEIIIREKAPWDIGRMRKFFEGPVVNFVKDRYADIGVAMGKGDVREALKAKFLGFTEEHGLRVPVSTTSLTKPGWKDLLTDIDHWCMDEFGCGLPEAENTDLGD